jgi:hypothetical protein
LKPAEQPEPEAHEALDELFPNRLPLALWVFHPSQLAHHLLLGIDHRDRQVQRLLERRHHARPLVVAEQAVVDKHAVQAVADHLRR